MTSVSPTNSSACSSSSSSPTNEAAARLPQQYQSQQQQPQPCAAAAAASQSSQSITATNSIIALNNAAIALLQRGGCRCAIDTFKDGLELLKSSTDVVAFTNAAMHRVRERNARNGVLNGGGVAATATAAAAAPSESSGVVVLPYDFNPEQAYNLLSNVRTSKVCLTMQQQQQQQPYEDEDEAQAQPPPLDVTLVRAVLVYNYGIAHRCCIAPGQSAAQLGSFCVQIFQYAETLLPASANLLFRLVLTRNLMMLSCRLGMALCEHYKETLDPIVADILGPPVPDGENHTTPAA